MWLLNDREVEICVLLALHIVERGRDRKREEKREEEREEKRGRKGCVSRAGRGREEGRLGKRKRETVTMVERDSRG